MPAGTPTEYPCKVGWDMALPAQERYSAVERHRLSTVRFWIKLWLKFSNEKIQEEPY